MTFKRAREAAVSTLAVVLIVLVVIAVVAIILVAPLKSVNVDEEVEVPYQEGLSSLQLSLKCDLGQVSVGFVNDTSPLVSMTVKGVARQSLVTSGDPVRIVWDASAAGPALSLAAEVRMDTFSTSFGLQEIEIDMLISDSLVSDITVEHSVGAVRLYAGEGVSLSNLRLVQKTGEVAASIGPGTTLSGDVSLESTTGAARLDWEDVDVEGDVAVDLHTTTGSVSLRMVQGHSAPGNVTLQASATTGGIQMEMDIEDGVSSRVSSSASIGNVEVLNRQGFDGDDTLLSSSNYPAGMSVDVFLSTSTGGITLDLSYT
ncbi:MAG: hypothetical protein MUE65_03150 [Methanomassiliicoccales archaeon]|nr:hypothetical protein [Methanomassiliicoccales archaeon]